MSAYDIAADVAAGRCGHASAIDHVRTRAASFADLRDHVVLLMKRRECMACADVETAKAKTAPINLTIFSSYVNLQDAFLEARCSGEASRLWRKARVVRRALQHLFYEPRPTKRKWVDVPTFSGANPVLVTEKRSVSSGDVARDLHPRRDPIAENPTIDHGEPPAGGIFPSPRINKGVV